MWARGFRGRLSKDDLVPVTLLLEGVADDREALEDEIRRLTEAGEFEASADRERLLLRLRNQLAIHWLNDPAPGRGYPEPKEPGRPADRLVELSPAELTPERLRGAILSCGCALVRGLVDPRRAQALADEIDRAFTERNRHEAGRSFDQHYYAPFEPDPRAGWPILREWIEQGGGVLAVDSPRLSSELGRLYGEIGLPQLVAGYLGERPLVAADKTTLRRAEPSVSGGWHQDGKFMGSVKALNLWLTLSHCGDVAPGLDLVPRRLEEHVATMTDEARMLNQVAQRAAEQAAGEAGIVRPIFQPGDALLFDEMFLHKTASDPAMRKPRYAIENWFFAPSGFPENYVPLTL
jgi:hypothetical protein